MKQNLMKNEVQAEQKQLHAIVEGRVQGVGFRYFVSQHAVRLHLSGWVRNTWDEKVEVLAEGNLESLNQLLHSLQTGPRSAFVNTVNVSWKPASGDFNSFSIAPTV